MAAMSTAAEGAAAEESWSPQDKPSVPSRSGGQQVYPVYVVPRYFEQYNLLLHVIKKVQTSVNQ